ncbi:hypothetical protein DL98DRAFT_289072 [Cadophora sp. DSE1049]|nr:hypothetical protein DL98DRAFT_289072 [Cadophora sp. DSE1049]
MRKRLLSLLHESLWQISPLAGAAISLVLRRAELLTFRWFSRQLSSNSRHPIEIFLELAFSDRLVPTVKMKTSESWRATLHLQGAETKIL